eukprot:CAMPEP_0178705626 /NCGR_PEP_ID=MMETSP0699-20121125/14916_1 /TAXON_ID=265572 /ORGANISM="Extubocellulus spinifer, Strain CCMP396" /LENGTH=150 /DNA_ID=CAMNT_0020353257 /DNA_START=499 /DNA_END=951 /DNA_ORIENTATION=-
MVHARSAQPDDAPILGTVHDRSCLRWLFYHRVLKESAEFGERVERRWPDATALDLFPYQCARNAVAAPSHRQGALLTLEAAGERLALWPQKMRVHPGQVAALLVRTRVKQRVHVGSFSPPTGRALALALFFDFFPMTTIDVPCLDDPSIL